MLRVGLTGGVGSGKSTVTAMLAARGAATLDADEVIRRLYTRGGAGAAAVTRLFGSGPIAPGGSVDRAALGRIVLGDPGARTRLEAEIHPLVRAEIARWAEALEARAAPPPVAVVEAALLVETGSYRSFDLLVVVSAPLAVRRARALASGWTAERFDRTVAAQLPDAAREAVADRVVHNGGDREALAAAVDALWQDLLARTPHPGRDAGA